MTSRLVALCFDASDPLRLGRFWAETLDWQIHDENPDEIRLLPADDSLFRITFLRVPEQKVRKNRIHLDLATVSIGDQTETVGNLIELGAYRTDVGQHPDERHVVLADPEGNEFCILEPGNSFVDDRGRLGSITCDGSRQVGCFWSEVLGWPLVRDQDEETAIRARDSGPFITWGGVRRCHRRPRRTGSISTSLPSMVIGEQRWTAWSPLGRPGSTSGRAMSIGRSWPTPMATNSVC